MLYVFLVGSGTMITFDMSLACGNVAALQHEISEKCMIPKDQQVLLVSGGAVLDPNAKVIKYSAGTDTNPIFLCTRTGIDGMGLYLDDEIYINVTMSDRVRACENMVADQQTLAVRTQLAQDMAEQANNEYTVCSQLVDSQHLQHQGWLAVIANLEDELKSLNKTFEVLENNAQEYFRSRPLYYNLLNNFHATIAKLGKIPVLPVLLMENDSSNADCHSLLTLFTRPEISLSDIAAQCQRWVEHLFNENTLEMLKKEVEKVAKDSKESDMREISGIEEWLFNLNKRLSDAKEIAASQCQRAKSFLIKHGRLNSKDEASTVMLLCTSHLEQLKQMLTSHNILLQVREHCSNAKRKLSENLQVRISWVACIENRIFDLKNKLAIYNLSLVRFRLHLDMIQEMHVAPEIYAKTLVEVRRRKSFSGSYLKWASCISDHATEMREKEVTARDAFKANKSKNFVDSLFPGMDDYPPRFATPCPEPFDELLPIIKQEDLDKLKQVLPDLSSILDVPPPQDIMPPISGKSTVSDSAFSSEVPSSNIMGGRSMSSASLRSCHLCRTATMSSSMAGEASNLPEVSSPASSPFEDFSDSHKSAKAKTSVEAVVECKVLPDKETFSPIAEEQNNVESDGDEFERVDNVPKCVYDPFDNNPTSDSNKMSKSGEVSTKITVEHATPSTTITAVAEDRLQSPDSMVTSHDFHSTDYFFDDSMPSSYTESTGISALGKNQQQQPQHMVKSHHVIVAELQQQLGDKAVAVEKMQGCSPRVSRPADLTQLHATLSAFQKFVQDLREKTTGDLSALRELVVTQRQLMNSEISAVVKEVTETISTAQVHGELEKLQAIEEALSEEGKKNRALLQSIELQLEVESNKLWDMSREVELYQEQIHRQRETIDEEKQRFNQHLQEVQNVHKVQVEEMRKEMEVEHELEMYSLRKQLEQKMSEKDDQISNLLADLESKETQIQMLHIEKENLEMEFKEQLAKENEKWSLMVDVGRNHIAVQCVDEDFKCETEEELPDISKVTISDLLSEEGLRLKSSDEEVLNFALKNEKLFLPLYFELCRLWNVLYFDFRGQKIDDFPHKFKSRIDEQVDGVIANHPEELVLQKSQHESLFEPLIDESEKILMDLTQQISRFTANRDVSSLDELVKVNDRLVEICVKSAEHFQTWGPSSVYNQRFIKSMDDVTEDNKAQISKLKDEVRAIEKKHLEEIERLKSIHIAEKQVSFNEVINKVTHEKDEVISVLNNEVSSLEKFQEAVKSVFSYFLERYTSFSEATGDSAAQTEAKTVYKVLVEMKRKIEEPRNLPSPLQSSKMSPSLLVTKMRDLEKELKKERAKLSKIFEKVTMAETVKLALFTCDPGDIVLFCYDEKHKNYVAFHFGNTPHFLHSDCIKVLKLQVPPESASTSWAIGVIIDKEYYLAKKKPNRYNVRHGSVFYCVKVQPFGKGEEMRCMVEPEVSTLQTVMTTSESDISKPSTSAASDMSASAI